MVCRRIKPKSFCFQKTYNFLEPALQVGKARNKEGEKPRKVSVKTGISVLGSQSYIFHIAERMRENPTHLTFYRAPPTERRNLNWRGGSERGLGAGGYLLPDYNFLKEPEGPRRRKGLWRLRDCRESSLELG